MGASSHADWKFLRPIDGDTLEHAQVRGDQVEKAWEQIGHPYEVVFTNEQREELQTIIESYFVWADFERNAEDAKRTFDFLDGLEKPAGELQRRIVERGISEAVADAEGPLNKYLQSYWAGAADPYGEDDLHAAAQAYEPEDMQPTDQASNTTFAWSGKNLDLIADAMGALIVAIRKTREDLDDQTGHVEGSAWRQFLINLINWAEAQKLTVSAAKYEDPSMASPFIKFVYAILKNEEFPSDFRKSYTLAGLSDTVQKIRREMKSRENSC